MNTKIIPTLAATLLALLPGAAFSAQASFTAGDILMGFRATAEPGSSSSYVVNLGPIATLRDATSATTLNLGNISADLVATYGPSWYTRTDLFWGVAGTPSNVADVNGDPAPTLYGSRVENTPGVPQTAWTVAGAQTRTGIATLMKGFQDAFSTYEVTANSNKAVLQSSANNYDWRAYMAPSGDADKTTGSKDFGAFAEIEANPSKTLSLFRLPNQQQGLFVGSFSINASGDVTFTPGATATTYATWALTNAPGQTETEDYDNDGLPNGVEFFMGTPGNAATAHPGPVNGVIKWNRAANVAVTSFGVQISSDLGAADPWHAPTPGPVITAGSVEYTLPTGLGKVFARLTVTP